MRYLGYILGLITGPDQTSPTLCLSTNPESMNGSEAPESTRDISWVSGMVSDVTGIMRTSGVVMVALRVMVVCA